MLLHRQKLPEDAAAEPPHHSSSRFLDLWASPKQTQTETRILELHQGRCRHSGGRRLPRRLHSEEEAFEVLITL